MTLMYWFNLLFNQISERSLHLCHNFFSHCFQNENFLLISHNVLHERIIGSSKQQVDKTFVKEIEFSLTTLTEQFLYEYFMGVAIHLRTSMAWT